MHTSLFYIHDSHPNIFTQSIVGSLYLVNRCFEILRGFKTMKKILTKKKSNRHGISDRTLTV
jgi:hypothetical protein